MATAQNEAPADGAGFTQKFNEEFTKYKEKALEITTFPENRLRYEADLENMRATLTDNALRFESSARAAAQTTSLSTAFAANENTVRASPTTDLNTIIEQERVMVNAATGPASAKNKIMSERSQRLYNAAVEGSISILIKEKSIVGLQSLDENLRHSGSWKKQLSPQDYENALNQTSAAIHALELAGDSAYKKWLSEQIEERAYGTENGLSPTMARGDPAVERQITNAIEIGDARHEIRAVPYSKMVQMVESASKRLSVPGDWTADKSYAQAIMQAAQDRSTAFKADPASYAIQNSQTVATAFKAMQESNFAPQAVAEYRTVAAAMQRDMGDPAHTPKLLPKMVIDQLAAQVASMPAESVADGMEELRKKYGPMWTEVMGELQQDKKVRSEYLTLARLDAPRDAVVRVDLAEAIKSDEIIRKNLPEGDAKMIDDKVSAALLPYARTLSRAGAAGQAILRGEERSAQQLAYYYRMQGSSVSDAATKATDALINSKYDFGNTFLAPKDERGQSQLGPAERESRRIMRETPVSQFVEQPGGDPNLSPEYRRNATMLDAQRGYWVNITDLEKNRLGIEWLDGSGKPVTLKDGQRVRLFFDELKNLPPEPRRASGPVRSFGSTPGGAATYGAP